MFPRSVCGNWTRGGNVAGEKSTIEIGCYIGVTASRWQSLREKGTVSMRN